MFKQKNHQNKLHSGFEAAKTIGRILVVVALAFMLATSWNFSEAKKNNGKGKGEDNGNDTPVITTYYTEGEIGPAGGQLKINLKNKETTKVRVPEGALKKDKLITMAITTDHETRVDFEFGPHGTKFDKPVEIKLSWAYLGNNVKSDALILYYYDNGKWVEETTGKWEDNEKHVKLYIDHFSRYYYNRE